jgi:hypothetical protein
MFQLDKFKNNKETKKTKYFHVMLILKAICCFFDKKPIFFCFSTFLMYFGFFKNFDKVFGIAQKSTWSLNFFYSDIFNNHNHTTTYQKIRRPFFSFFLNLKNLLKYSTFSMVFTFYLRHLDTFRYNLET